MGQTLQQKERMKEKYRKKRNRKELKEYLPRLAWGSAKRSGNRIGRCSTKEIHVKYMYSVLFCVPSGIAGIIICVSRGGRTTLKRIILATEKLKWCTSLLKWDIHAYICTRGGSFVLNLALQSSIPLLDNVRRSCEAVEVRAHPNNTA